MMTNIDPRQRQSWKVDWRTYITHEIHQTWKHQTQPSR